ncbi:MAG: glycoside hydrolase family 55 protein, partial [Verrucomicrobiae bacterium]|nr:glycoside hydrolase family 55 protein [Verrucomicrobiae bacterium]
AANAMRWTVPAPSGTNDQTGVIQRLLDEAGRAGGGVVEVPAGRHVVRGNLTGPANVTLQGTFRVPPTVTRRAGQDLSGSVLLAYAGRGQENGAPFIRLGGHNAAIAGLIIVYPDWKQTDVPPVPYPPCVLADRAENVGIENCLFLNPYEAIRLVRAARHLVRNVTGYPIRRGIYVDECYDIGRIENVHFWPFGVHYKPDDPYCRWINLNGVAFEFARTDWHYVFNTFCFGYGIGYKFSETKAGCANGNFLGLGADCCERAVVVEQAQEPGLLITNGEFVGRWSSTNAVCVEIGPEVRGRVSLVNCSFWGPIDRCVWMRSARGQFTASACHFVDWDAPRADRPAIQLEAGRAIVQGCTFEREGIHVEVAEPVKSALLVGNQARGGFTVENRAGQRTQLAANETSPVQWTADAKRHYRIVVGADGDGAYLRRWYGREGGERRTWRWSAAESLLRLPVVPGERYQLTLKLSVPKQAVSPEAGLYMNDKRLGVVQQGGQTLTVELPASATEQVVLRVLCSGWVPAQAHPGSTDHRTLGVQLHEIVMKSERGGERLFDANTGQWK